MRPLPRLVNLPAEPASKPARVTLAACYRKGVPESEVPPLRPMLRRMRPTKGHLGHASKGLDLVRINRHEAPLGERDARGDH